MLQYVRDPAQIAKALVVALMAILIILNSILNQQPFTTKEVEDAIAAVAAVIGVFAVPNKPAPVVLPGKSSV